MTKSNNPLSSPSNISCTADMKDDVGSVGEPECELQVKWSDIVPGGEIGLMENLKIITSLVSKLLIDDCVFSLY